MLLVGLTWKTTILGFLYVSLAILVLVIAYRKLLKYLGKGKEPSKSFLEVHSPEIDNKKKQTTFYIVATETQKYKLSLLNINHDYIELIKEGEAQVGGNIIRFDHANVTPGKYFFEVTTEDQKTTKRIDYVTIE